MSDDQIPDPTELRRKLGLAKIPASISAYKRPSSSELSRLKDETSTGATLADFEPVPRVVDPAEEAKIEELLEGCPPACARWLVKYITLGNKSSAARAIDYSAATVGWWKKAHPKFAHLLSFYDDEIRLRWNEVAERRALQGFKEDVFTAEGKLKMTRVRQDPQFLKEMMKKLDPDWKEEALGTQITINVVRTEE